MYVRPITLTDHDVVLELAQKAGFGMTSLPPDAGVLRAKVEKAAASFAGQAAHPGDESYLFALVDPENNLVVGIAGIKAKVGLRQPFYSYLLSTITQASRELDIFSVQKVLSIVNDYTGATEIGSLFLLPEYRRDRIGRFLSRMRFLFMAQFRERFDERVISEIRGVHDKDGNSPFYDGIARHFFRMEFSRADYVNATQGNQFITDLMPKYPIYVNLLPKAAQEVIGQPYPSSEPAKAMLEKEGFFWNDYLDIFDGGPTLEARFGTIRTIAESRVGQVGKIVPRTEGEKYIFSAGDMAHFRSCVGRLPPEEETLTLSEHVTLWLGVGKGDTVRCVRL